MKSSIMPMSAVSPDLVRDYLHALGLAPEIALWKYFDEGFNRGRVRGYVWFSKERERGFIGVIPVTVATPAGDRDMVWTCDWSVEEWERNPGVGVRLLSKVQQLYGFVGGVGGTDNTHAILPRMQTCTVSGAAVFLHLPLRSGALLEKLEGRFAFLPRLSRTPLGRVPLPARKRARKAGTATFEEGVSAALHPLFDQPAADLCRIRHDAAFLQWQIGRCPTIRSMSCVVEEGGRPAAGALLWSPLDNPGYWRVVLRALPGADALLESVLAHVVERLGAERAALVSIVVSYLDRSVLDLLARSGFVEGSQRWPLYIPERDEPGACQEGFLQMSYLDSDLACRF